MSLKDDFEKFRNLPPREQKQIIKVLQMAEAEGLLSPSVSQDFLALLEPENAEQ